MEVCGFGSLSPHDLAPCKWLSFTVLFLRDAQPQEMLDGICPHSEAWTGTGSDEIGPTFL